MAEPSGRIPRAWRAARLPIAAVALAALGVVVPAARADVVTAVNSARSATCGRATRLQPLVETRALDRAAAALARGATLHEALASLPVRPEFAASLHLAGVGDERGIARAVAGRSCGDLGNPALRELGVGWSGPNLYLLVAAPLPVPAPGDRAGVEREILTRVNDARSHARRCGGSYYPPAAPLALSVLLSRVAAGHSAAMGARDDLAHSDPDGSTPADRVRRAGYNARLVGENVASGVPTAGEVVSGWLASPGHCANIMDARFTEMGVAYAVAPRTSGSIYWTQLFAARGS